MKLEHDEYYVTVETTPFYRTSPQQGMPPDGQLEEGVTVQIIAEMGQFAHINLPDRTRAWVVASALFPSNASNVRRSTSGNGSSSRDAEGHLDKVELHYGGKTLPLMKSDKYIAVKPRPEMDRAVLSEMTSGSAIPDVTGPQLGGFQLVAVSAMNGSMEEALDALRASPGVKSGTHVFHTSDDEVPFVPTGQIYIECAVDAAAEDCQSLMEQHRLEIVEARPNNVFIVQVTPGSANPVKTAKALQASPLISVAEPDLATPGKLLGFTVPGDLRIVDQWHLRNRGFHRGTAFGFRPGADARVIDAWEAAGSVGSPNVVVAIIDDGFDLSHPDLSGDWKVVAPKDFTRNSASPIPDPLMSDWHGTACAGVAVGNADGTGIVGAAPRCRFMPIRWGRDLADREIENWFGYAREQGAWVVSCSWGAAARRFVLSTRAARAIERCAREGRNGLGTVICFAAGNEDSDINDTDSGTINGFAIHPDVIAVAASTSRDQRSDYSNFGSEISVCAPSSGAGGWGITTSDVMGQYSRGGQTFESGYSVGAYTNEFGGTSSACPLVAGICALLLSIRPELTANEVRELIQRTARRIGQGSGYNAGGHSIFFGYGCIDASAAVRALAHEDTILPFWGTQGHKSINRLAIEALRDELRDFYQLHAAEIVRHAMDADNAKQRDRDEKGNNLSTGAIIAISVGVAIGVTLLIIYLIIEANEPG